MDLPTWVAVSASDAAALGVLLAQDLYRLALENPTVECQIGRIAQAFIDLNQTLADLASALMKIQDSLLSLSPLCSDLVDTVVSRIHGMQKSFWAKLNDNDLPNGELASDRSSLGAKQSTSTTKLSRLKMLFPGSEVAERLTEMEWIRNTLALLAATCRLAITQEPSQRNISETLVNALFIYVRMIELKMAGPDEDVDDPFDDTEAITGPGSLLFIASVNPVTTAAKSEASLTEEKESVVPEVGVATWIYEALWDKAKEGSATEDLPSHFVDWLLDKLIITKTEVKPKENATGSASDSVETVECAVQLKGRAADAAYTELVAQPATAEHDTSAATESTSSKTAGVDENIKTADLVAENHLLTAHMAAAPETFKDAQDEIQQKADRPTESDFKFAAEIDTDQKHDDLPPPYPSLEEFVPHGRGPPFVGPTYPFPQMNRMPYPLPSAPPGQFTNPIYMQPQPAVYPTGLYPIRSPYMASQPFIERDQPSFSGFEARFMDDRYNDPAPISRLGPGPRNFPIVPPRSFVPRRRHAATTPDPAFLSPISGEESIDKKITSVRHRKLQGRCQRQSSESQEFIDNEENVTGSRTVAGKNRIDLQLPTGSYCEQVVYVAKKQGCAPLKQRKKSNKLKSGAYLESLHNDHNNEDSFSCYSDTYDAKTIESFTDRNKNNAVAQHAKRPHKGCPPPSTDFSTTPADTPSVSEDDDDRIEGSRSTARTRSEAKAKNAREIKNEVTQKTEDHHDGHEREVTDHDDNSEYESAIENIDDGKTQNNDIDRVNGNFLKPKFSAAAKHDAFTSSTIPFQMLPGDAPMPFLGLHMHPGAARPVATSAENACANGHASGVSGYPYFGHPQLSRPPFRLPPHPVLGENVVRDGPEAVAAAGFDPDRYRGNDHQYAVHGMPVQRLTSPATVRPAISQPHEYNYRSRDFHVQNKEHNERVSYYNDSSENYEYYNDVYDDYCHRNQYGPSHGPGNGHSNGSTDGTDDSAHPANNHRSIVATEYPFLSHRSQSPSQQPQQGQYQRPIRQRQQPPRQQRHQPDDTQLEGDDMSWTERPLRRHFSEEPVDWGWPGDLDQQALQQQPHQIPHMPHLFSNLVLGNANY
ncbi:hypothetical protein SEPCBS57363_001374 [Sporothrix epigloea]|uniref:Uncharacterized protein n=1 Tax=Sporothrix epigloea TaxID=1892477 RepID=A0ABP0DCZ0_9PEZI